MRPITRRRTPLTALMLGAGLIHPCVALAQGCDPTEVAKLLASDGAANDYFAGSVAIDGHTAVVGVSQDDTETGSAYVYHFDGSQWEQVAKLVASDGFVYDHFGLSVAISGGTIVVGASGDEGTGSNNGAAYVFNGGGSSWTETAKLVASDRFEIDYFGTSVAIADGIILIGSYRDDDNGHDSGSVYPFHFDGSSWVEQPKLTPSDGAQDDWFGQAIALEGDTAVIGARLDDDNGADSGSVYVFRFDGSQWSEQAKLLPADGEAGDLFGNAVAVSGDTIMVGAYSSHDHGASSGSAYVYEYDGSQWNQQAKLLASDAAMGDLFGFMVAVSGETAVITARRDNDNGENAGSSYVFRFDGTQWIERSKFHASDGAAGDEFGVSMAVSGQAVIVGAYADDDLGINSGAAYLYDLSCTNPCPADLTGSTNPSDPSYGVPDGLLDANDFFFYLDLFSLGDAGADLTGSSNPSDPSFGVPDGLLDANDFFYYLALFAAGC